VGSNTARESVQAEAPEGGGPAREAVTGLYQAHALGLIRLGVVMLGDRAAAEDVVQEAFCGLFSHWATLADPARALPYLRSAVLNGCRSAWRRQRRRPDRTVLETGPWQTAESAEASVLLGEEHRQVLAALQRLPERQREALVLRFYLELAEHEIAACMGVSQGTVKSTTSRALAALGRLIREAP
jgi:RNA polymerase sigma-70 factor (sigma-E family)